ncbi:MAG: ParB/RepB/Spo0J family partition protein, partial [Solirubrobacterales bacterium]|nr:ParB/RepB/Spo0J family partition protein [Solirubrobacterales bacterium]
DREAGEASGPRGASPGRAPVHPDQQAAMSEIADALGAALGTDVRVRPRGAGYKVELAFASPDEALALAARVARG